MNFDDRHHARIDRDDHHFPKQDPKCVGLVEVQDVAKPNLGVVFNHGLNKSKDW